MYNFDLSEIAHVIVNDRSGIINTLKEIISDLPDDVDDEQLFKVILDNKSDDSIQKKIIGILKKSPYHRHCIHCFEAIKPVYLKGVHVKSSMKK